MKKDNFWIFIIIIPLAIGLSLLITYAMYQYRPPMFHDMTFEEFLLTRIMFGR